jgi:hypothetical protein
LGALGSALADEFDEDESPFAFLTRGWGGRAKGTGAPGGPRPPPNAAITPAPKPTQLTPMESAAREAAKASASAASVASWANVAAQQVAASANANAASVAASATSEAQARASAWSARQAASASRSAAYASYQAKESAAAAAEKASSAAAAASYSLARSSAAAARTAAAEAAKASWSAARSKPAATALPPKGVGALPPRPTVTQRGREEDAEFQFGELKSQILGVSDGDSVMATTTEKSGRGSITEIMPVYMTSPVVAEVPGFVSA